MKFRMSDADAVSSFSEVGVPLKVKRIQVNHRTLHYVQTGNDSFPTILFVHGSPGSWDAFAGYMKDKMLLSRYRMISVDRPGFGYSNFGDALNLQDQSMIISGLLQREKNGKPIYLVGHSLGGPLVVQLAADNPGVFDALVLLAASIDPAAEKPEKWRLLFMNNPLKFLVPGAMRPSNDELWYLKKDLVTLQPLFAAVSCRVYIVHGNKDVLVPYSNMAYGVKSFTQAALVDTLTIPGANHFIPWSHFQTVRGVLMKL